MNRERLTGRRVAITGGTTGIGLGIASVLARSGAKVAVCGHDDQLDEALAALRAHDPDAWGQRTDLAEPKAAGAFLDDAAQRLGGLDAVIANAGRPAGGLCDMDEDDWRDAVAVNLTSVLATCHHAARHLGDGGDIVITGSMSAHRPGAGSSVYVAANGGLQVFAEAFRREMGERGVHVTLVEPGKTASSLFGDTYTPGQIEAFQREGRMLAAEDVGHAVRFALSTPHRCVVTGVRLEPRLHV